MKCCRARDEFSLGLGCTGGRGPHLLWVRNGPGGAQPRVSCGGQGAPEGSSEGALCRDPLCFGAEWGVLPSEVPLAVRPLSGRRLLYTPPPGQALWLGSPNRSSPFRLSQATSVNEHLWEPSRRWSNQVIWSLPSGP